jgi:hypothetical protein
MKKLLASLSIAVILAVGLFVASPVKGSVLHPQTAGACGWFLANWRSNSWYGFDYYYYKNTYVYAYIYIYSNGCGSYQIKNFEYVADGSPASFRSAYDWQFSPGCPYGGVGYAYQPEVWSSVVACSGYVSYVHNWEGGVNSYIHGAYLANPNIVLNVSY